MACSREEIERKRLAAIQKIHNRTFSSVNTTPVKSRPNNIGNALQNGGLSQPLFGNNKMTTESIGRKSPLYSKRTSYLKNKLSCHPYAANSSEQKDVYRKVISGTIYLISEDRFEVNPSDFSQELIAVFKSISSKNYDAKSRLWNFSICDYEELQRKIAPLSPNIVLGQIPQCVLNILKEPAVDASAVDLTPIEPTLRNKLMPFQREGVSFGIVKRGRCMIADDMGLGKTFQALAIASYYRQNWPLLIVTTASMRGTWQSNVRDLLPSVPMLSVVSLTSGKDSQQISEKQTEVVIVSYKMTSVWTQLLKDKHFGAVILDESHYLKSHKAQCTVALTTITRRASRVILLSGTPALSRPVELYTQLSIIVPGFFNGFTEFGKRYCAGKITNFGWDMSGQSNLQELHIILQRKFLIRRTKEQVLTDLQDRTRETVMLDPTLLAINQTERKYLDAKAAAYNTVNKSTEKQAALLSYFNESAKVKVPAICKYIEQLLKQESCEKFLVFAHHKEVIDAVCETLDEQRTPYICITGSTKAENRSILVERFQFSDSCRCAVLSITAANAGITLTAAQLVLFAEIHWNPGILTQAESRAHRIGQSGHVCVRYLLAMGTSDDYMWPMLQGKLNVLNEVGLSKDTFKDNTFKQQDSKNKISYHFDAAKNKDEYIPGTNIRKNPIKVQPSSSNPDTTEYSDFAAEDFGELAAEDFGELAAEDFEESFLEDEEGDELLANVII